MSIFHHSGRLGDILYSLPALRALGGGHLVLTPWLLVGALLTPTDVENLGGLLRCQPYIRSVTYAPHKPPDCIDLNGFRHQRWLQGQTLADLYLRALGLPAAERDQAWLGVEPHRVAPVVIHRSARYQDPNFPWPAALRRYRRAGIVFVGTPAEHRDFVAAFGPVAYHATADFLALARVIAGADLFIGNQSAPYAVAEGLKQRTVQETHLPWANCVFRRANAAYSLDLDLQWPALDAGG